jgi:hypothetical protein
VSARSALVALIIASPRCSPAGEHSESGETPQIDESNTEIAVIAAAVGALHVVAAIVAVRRRRL